MVIEWQAPGEHEKLISRNIWCTRNIEWKNDGYGGRKRWLSASTRVCSSAADNKREGSGPEEHMESTQECGKRAQGRHQWSESGRRRWRGEEWWKATAQRSAVLREVLLAVLRVRLDRVRAGLPVRRAHCASGGVKADVSTLIVLQVVLEHATTAFCSAQQRTLAMLLVELERLHDADRLVDAAPHRHVVHDDDAQVALRIDHEQAAKRTHTETHLVTQRLECHASNQWQWDRVQYKCTCTLLVNEVRGQAHTPERVAGRLLEHAVCARDRLRAVREQRQVQRAHATLLSRHLRPARVDTYVYLISRFSRFSFKAEHEISCFKLEAYSRSGNIRLVSNHLHKGVVSS